MKSHLGRLTVLAVATSIAVASDEPRPPREPDTGFHELGRLWAGLARHARDKDREPLKAAHRYLHAARAFQRAGEDEARQALTAGVLAARALRATWVLNNHVVAMTFLPGDRQVVLAHAGGRVRVLDAAGGKEVRSFVVFQSGGRRRHLSGASFNPDRTRMLAWDFGGVELWDIATGERLRAWDWQEAVAAATFVHGDRQILAWGHQSPARLYDVRAGKEVRTFDRGLVGGYRASLSPDETYLLTGARRQVWGHEAVYLYDMARAEPVRTFKAESDYDNLWAAFTPDGTRLLVYGYADGSADLYSIATGRRVASFPRERPRRSIGRIDGAEFSPDGRRLLTWEHYGRVRLWDVAGGEVLGTYAEYQQYGARFSADGKRVIVFGRPATLWDAADGKLVGTMGPAGSAVFTRDGMRVLLYGRGRAELWTTSNPNLPELVRAFGPDAAGDAVLSGDETLLLVQSLNPRDQAVHLWDLRRPTPPGR